MLRGFMDHWVPTVDAISTFWKTDAAACKQLLDGLHDQVAFNNFTFYTKWYTNGINTELPFLRNHPDSSNVKTDNDWGRELIDHLHDKGMTCGAMLQMYTYEKQYWSDLPVLGEWDLSSCAATTCVLADFTCDEYRSRLAQLLREQLILFPGLDYLFLEFEGVTPEMAALAYNNHRAKYPDLPALEEITYADQDVATIEGLGQPLDIRCSQQVLDMFRFYMHKNLQTAQDVCNELGYRGRLGVVYYPPNYECLFMPDTLPSNRWRLLPWCYFGWLPDPKVKESAMKSIQQQMKQHLAAGKRLIYIGDATISPWDTDSIETMLDFCANNPVEGYLGMGNPVDNIGLRWLDVTGEQVQKVRHVFAKAWK